MLTCGGEAAQRSEELRRRNEEKKGGRLLEGFLLRILSAHTRKNKQNTCVRGAAAQDGHLTQMRLISRYYMDVIYVHIV